MSKKISYLVAFLLFLTFFTPALAIGKPQNASSAGQLRSCQARAEAIKTRSMNLTTFAENMEIKFDSIANRVKQYYTSSVLPSGKSVENYDTLVENIQTKKTAVSTALTTAQNNANDFTCDSGNPKVQMTVFREDMQAVKTALKEYRTAIKNLIVAIRSITGDQETLKPTPGEKD